MHDPKQLPYLINLLDDESEIVNEYVFKELASFGITLENELAKQRIVLSSPQRDVLQKQLGEYNRSWLKEQWLSWSEMQEDKKKLESVMQLLAEFQLGRDYPLKLESLLDVLAEEYKKSFSFNDPIVLAHFLFSKKELKGTEEDYYNPLNSNLVYVIEKQRGIPLSLACVYILVAYRLGVSVEGCNFPGHFLAIASTEHNKFLVDCFNGGRLVTGDDFLVFQNAAPMAFDTVMQLQCDATTMIARSLRNLAGAYQQAGDEENAMCMIDLLETIMPDEFKNDEEDDE
ncbi:MAG: transglutaminase family protein [Ignavibacteriales bacterium]|nr:transglutaminase family protein [Ignavibacteriales bacterium]